MKQITTLKHTLPDKFRSLCKGLFLPVLFALSMHAFAQPLTGIITVDNTLPEDGTNFARIGTLMAALNTSGVGVGGVVVKFKDDQIFVHDYSYSGISDIFLLSSTVGGVNNPLVFTRSGDGTKKPSIYLQSPGWEADGGRGWKLNQTDYVTIDGFNFVAKGGPFNGGDSTHRLGAIWINNTASDGCDHIAIVNNDFYMNGQNISDFCCDYGGVINSNFNTNSTGPYFTNSKINGNSFHDFKVAIRLWDVSSNSISNINNEYAYNTFTGFSLMAMQLMNHENTLIHHNIVSGLVANKGYADEREEIHAFFVTGNGNFQVYNNIIHGFTNTGTGYLRAVKMYQSATSVSTIANNMIYDFKCPAGASDPSLRLFEFSNSGKYNFYYNSVYLDNAGGNGYGATIIKGDHGNDKYNLANNIFVNNTSGAERTTMIWEDYSGVNVVSASSNNNLYYSNASSFAMISDAGGSDIAGTFASYQASKESSSYFEAVPFVSAADLHLQHGQPTAAIDGGKTIAGITTDIDGYVRSTTTPFIGADEFYISVTGLTLSVSGNAINAYQGKVLATVTFNPSKPTVKDYTYSLNPSGVVSQVPGNAFQAVTNGVVTVTATSVDNPMASSSVVITVSSQIITQIEILGKSVSSVRNDIIPLKAVVPFVDPNAFDTTYISDLTAYDVTVGYGSLMKDRSTDNNPITLQGKVYAKGVGSHAPASFKYSLDGKYKSFKSIVGSDDECGGGGTETFSVYGDGNLLLQSPVVIVNQAPYVIDVDVTGVQELMLVVGDGGDNYNCDHAVWADAKLLESKKPVVDNALIDWTVDNTTLASISGSGVLSSLSDGDVVVKAALKSDPSIYSLKTIKLYGNYILAYESFDYPAGAFNGKGGDYGWSENWNVQNGSAGYAAANTYPLTISGLISTNSYGTGGDAYTPSGRKLDVGGVFATAGYQTGGFIGAAGTTLYAGFVMRLDADNNNEKSIMFHENGTSWAAGGQMFGAGFFGGASVDNGTKYWSLKIGGTVYTTSSPIVIGEEALVVLKAQFDGSNTTISGFINPVPGSPEPAADVTVQTGATMTFQSMAYYGGNGTGESSVDEIRLGRTFASVTPSVPLPQAIQITSRRGNTIITDADTLTLSAQVLPHNALNSVNWTISDMNLATISGTGSLKSIANGVVTITATSVADPSISGSFVLSISGQFVPVASLSVTGTNTINVDRGTSQLVATAMPSDATNGSVTWSVDNTAVATVSGTGLVQALMNGVVTITSTSVSNPSVTATYEISISGQFVPVTSISVSGANTISVLSGTSQLTATAMPADATDGSVTWSVSDANIASISGTGSVQALTNGVVTVTATSVSNPSVTATYEVSVSGQSIAVTSVSVSGANSVSIAGGTTQLTALVMPLNATNASVTWSVSDMNLATVNSSGLVQAIANGVITITATSVDTPSISGSIEITLSNQGSVTTLPGGNTTPGTNISITISASSNTIDVFAGTLQLAANVSGGTITGVNWMVSDTALASVSANGLVSAHADGAITVTATSMDNSTITATYVITLVNQTASISQFGSLKASVYPNPASDILKISVDAKITSVKLLNTLGVTVYSGSSETLNISQLPKGIYLLYLTTDQGSASERVVKE